MKRIFSILIERYGDRFSTAIIYTAFVIVSLLVAAILFGILRSTGVMKLVFTGAVQEAEFGGAFAGFLATLFFLIQSYNQATLGQKLAIRGNVLSINGIPIRGVAVSVDGVDRRKYTDDTGWFEIEVDAQTMWTVRASYESRMAQKTIKRGEVHDPVLLMLTDGGRKEPIDFEVIAIDHRGRYWYETDKPFHNWFPYDRACTQYFKVSEAVKGADLSLDITIMNRASEPILLTTIGIEIVSVTWHDCALLIAGDIPQAVELPKGKAYEIRIPQKWNPSMFDPDKDTWIDDNTLVTTRLPDPVYVEVRAAFRYSLIVRDMFEGEHIILRLWAKTDAGEARSHPIAAIYALGSRV